MTRRGIRRLLILVAAAGAFAAAIGVAFVVRQQSRSTDLEEARAEGMRLYEAEQPAEAFPYLNTYVSTVKDDAEALLAFANCRLAVPSPNNRHVQSAIAAAKLASDVAPDEPAPLEFLLAVFARIDRQTETLDVCERLLAIDPTHRGALGARVISLTRLRRIDEALQAADELVSSHPEDVSAYAARVEVLRASGASPLEIEADLRAERISSRLSGFPMYHLRVAIASAEVAVSSSVPGERSDAFERATASVRRALEIGPRNAVEALEATGLLRRLGLASGETSLVSEADDAVDALIGSGSFGDAYTASESRRAWWRLDNDRAAVLADWIPTGTTDPHALGWLAYRAGADSAFASRLASIEGAESRYWLSTLEAISLATRGATPVNVDAALAGVPDAAAALDREPGLRDHADLLAMVRAESLVRAGQMESAREILLAAAQQKPARERARLFAALAGVYTRLAETEKAGALLLLLDEQGIDPDLAEVVVRRYLETRLRLTDTGEAEAEARSILERVAPAIEATPDDPELTALHARLLLVTGETERGLAEADRLTALEAPPPPASLAELARLTWSEDAELASRLLDLGGPLADAPLGLVLARASLETITAGPDAGLAVFDGARATHDGPRFALERARFMERHTLAGSLAAFEDASDRFAADAVVQQGVLESRTAWDEQPFVRRVIARLRNATGEDALEWRIASLRADLQYLDELDEDAQGSELSRITLELRRLSDRAPENTRLLRYTAIAYDRAGSVNEAIDALRKATEQDPEYAPELVRMLLREDRTAEANEALDTLSSLDGRRLTPRALRERAALLSATGRSAEAVDDRRLLARSGAPEDIAAYGMALAAAGETDEAREQAAALFALEASANAAASAAQILARAGLVDEAVTRYLDARAPIDGEAAARTALARMLISFNAWDDALEQASIARGTADDTEGENLVIMIHALLESGRTGEAASLAETASTPSRAARALRAALVDRVDGEGLARVLAASALSFGDGSDDLTDTLASFLLGESDRAAFDRAARTIADGRSPDLAWRALTEAARTESAAAFVAACEEAASALPRATWPLNNLALVHLNAGDLESAERTANRLADRLGRDSFRADLVRGRIAAARGAWDASLTWLLPHRDRIAAGESPAFDVLVLTRGLTRAGRPDEAEAVIEQQAAAFGAAPDLYLNSAMDLAPDDTERMRRWLERASGTDPAALAGAWAELARRSEAPEDARHARALFSSLDPSGLGVLGTQDLASVEVLLGERDAAEARLARLVEETPGDPMLLNNYAYLLVTEFGDPARAAELAGRALRGARDAGYPPMAIGVVGHTLASAQRALGQTAAAETSLRDAIREAGAFPDAVIELAEVLIESGNTEDAAALLALLPDPSSLTNMQRRRAEAAVRALD